MTPQALSTPRFVRRTRLGPNEYRKNFLQIDREVLTAVTSAEADRVTPLMSKVYLRLANAPERFWEREGVLRFEAEQREGKSVTAWTVLCELSGVASATARKALGWMHEQGIIGYYAGKNGVGVRIFLNRASSSIGVRHLQGAKKILTFTRASSHGPHASAGEAAFSDSYAVRESLDTDKNFRAPKNGADRETVVNSRNETATPVTTATQHSAGTYSELSGLPSLSAVEEIVSKLKTELEPALQAAARKAAAQEHERTREWLESRGLPKAARVAQHEAYNVLKKYGVISGSARGAQTGADVGRNDRRRDESHERGSVEPRLLTDRDVTDLAWACLAMLETKGQPVERTLSEMSTEAGGFLLPEDAARVCCQVKSLIEAGESRGGA